MRSGLDPDRINAHYQAGTATQHSATATYTYDGDGLRTSKTVNGTTETYVWDATTDDDPLLLSDGSTNYLYGPDDAPLEQMDGSGNLLWYHHDQQGSTRLLTNNAGVVRGTATYDAYGAITATTGTTTPLGYDGQYTDTETGLIYLRARYYDPVTAQFLTRDPATTQTGQPYQYADDDPLDQGDPSGLCPRAIAAIAHNRVKVVCKRVLRGLTVVVVCTVVAVHGADDPGDIHDPPSPPVQPGGTDEPEEGEKKIEPFGTPETPLPGPRHKRHHHHHHSPVGGFIAWTCHPS